jgi:arabinan endo-1,5-alpha-L-arabinosidase
MRLRQFLFVVAVLILPEPAARSPGASRPAIDDDFPDPTLLRAKDGYFYVYATQGGSGGRIDNIQVARSRYLTRWQRLGDALPVKPTWASRTQDYWAPHVSAHDGRYFLYYSAKPDAALSDASRGLCLAVATADSPQGPFVDMGKPLLCGEGFVNIDPMAFDDPATGKRLLYWGSGFQPIKVQELAADRMSFAPGSTPRDLLPTDPRDDPANYRRLVEGAWVVRRDSYYYLFYSGDNCCGPKAHYAALVARSRSAMGPFEAIDPQRGGIVLAADARWLAPGHNSVAVDAAGQSWIAYHAVDRQQPRTKAGDEINSRRVMLVGGWTGAAGCRLSDARRPVEWRPRLA